MSVARILFPTYASVMVVSWAETETIARAKRMKFQSISRSRLGLETLTVRKNFKDRVLPDAPRHCLFVALSEIALGYSSLNVTRATHRYTLHNVWPAQSR